MTDLAWRSTRSTLARVTLALVVGALALTTAPQRARACGGFFCSSTPVVQAGEQVVYAIDADGTLTMSVRIYYEGAAPEFAWILPVPETPEITLGTTVLFDGLDYPTRPAFYVGEYRTEGTCRTPPSCEFPPAPDAGPWWGGADAARWDAAPAADSGTGPTIFAEGSLGPYETVVIGGASATEIHDWLTANGYDLPASAIPLLDAYVAAGQRFVALRLRTDASVSEIQPITLGFGGVAPCLPIRLTAIATQPDLPITAFFLADLRATPSNYSLIETPYPATLFLGTVSYEQWVSNEADDLGGRAFIADYAGATPTGSIGTITLPSVTDLASVATPEELVSMIWGRGYSGDPQLLAILTRFIVPPAGATPREYFNCLAFASTGCGVPMSFDPAGLVAAIDLAITQPRVAAQAWLDGHAYTTRLYTTMSAEEMTVDPEFILDPGLGDLSNLHLATQVTVCDAAHFLEDAALRLDLPSGESAPIREARPSPTDAVYCSLRGGWLAGMRPDAGPGPAMDAGPRTPGGGGGSACSVARGRRAETPAAGLLLALAMLAARRRRSPR